jgi:hypothetical protein
MTCKEVIQVLGQLTSGSAKLSKNHYDWMTSETKLLPIVNIFLQQLKVAKWVPVRRPFFAVPWHFVLGLS